MSDQEQQPQAHAEQSKCFGCGRVIQPGDLYIKDTLGGYCDGAETPGGSEVDALLGRMLSGTGDGGILFCQDCTESRPEGRYHLLVMEDSRS